MASIPSTERLSGAACPHCGTILVRRSSGTTPYVTCPDCRDEAVMTGIGPIDRALQTARHRLYYEDPEYWGRHDHLTGHFLGIFDYHYTHTVWWECRQHERALMNEDGERGQTTLGHFPADTP